MGPLSMTGLAIFGTTIALGLLISATPKSAGPIDDVPARRGFAVILIALVTGIGVLGAVVGLLAIFVGDSSQSSDTLQSVVPAVVGGLIGLGLVIRRVRELDPPVAFVGIGNLGSMAILGGVVSTLAVVIVERGTASPVTWPFPILGVASAAAALGIGVTGARSLRAMVGADAPTIQAIRARQIARGLMFQLLGLGATAVAIALVVLA